MDEYIKREDAIESAKHAWAKGLEPSQYLELIPAANVALMQGWVPISEGNPKEKGCYLVTVKHWVDGKPVAREAYWNGADWLSCDKRHEITPRVIHWMPLPEPAKEE